MPYKMLIESSYLYDVYNNDKILLEINVLNVKCRKIKNECRIVCCKPFYSSLTMATRKF